MAWSKEQYRLKAKTKTACKNCGKMVNYSGMPKHVLTKKCKNHNDKTESKSKGIDKVSSNESHSGVTPNTPQLSESKSKILSEINLKSEFETMAEKINAKGKADEKKYECGECHGQFNEKSKHCPHCGIELE